MQGSLYIKLLIELQNALKGLINLKNEDNECFRWCHIRYLNPQEKNPQRIKNSDRQYINNLDYSGVTFPLATKDYHKIEAQNNININVFGYEKKQFYPIYISKQKNEQVLNLLLITDGEKSHYVLIKDFNSLMTHKTKHNGKKYFCMHCLQAFTSIRILDLHKENCLLINGEQAIKMPKRGSAVYFKNRHKQQAAPFVIYADFD